MSNNQQVVNDPADYEKAMEFFDRTWDAFEGIVVQIATNSKDYEDLMQNAHLLVDMAMMIGKECGKDPNFAAYAQKWSELHMAPTQMHD